MLADTFGGGRLLNLLLKRTDWHPFPTAAQRPEWEALPEGARRAHLARGEALLGCDWAPLPATLFLDYVRDGNRTRYQQVRDGRRRDLCDLVIAECISGEGRFLDDIVNGIWTTCEETYWGVPAHVNVQVAGTGLPDVSEPTVDLFAAETASQLAWTLYLLGDSLDEVSTLVRPRIGIEIERRMLQPCRVRDDFWWMGFDDRRVNNWNPWVNSNWLTCVLLLEEDETRRVETVGKILRSLDKFIDPYPADGGCDEGPGYWGRAGASLFDCLELLHSASRGRLSVFDRSLIADMGRYIYRAHATGPYYVNFADATALVSANASLVYRYGEAIGDSAMAAFGAHLARQQGMAEGGVGDSICRQLPALFTLQDLLDREPAEPLVRDVWLPAIEVMTARDRQGSPDGFFVAAKGGHNAESHNHNDVGSFVVFLDGAPLLVDAGVESYTAKTFSSQRYEIWTMQSGYHNLPTIGQVMQREGKQFAARAVQHRAEDSEATVSMDIAGAYPPEAGLRTWRRTITLRRGVEVVIEDEYELEGEPAQITWNLLTACQVEVGAPSSGSVSLLPAELGGSRRSGQALLSFGPEASVVVEDVPLEDASVRRVWGERLRRIALRVESPASEGRCVITLRRS